MRRGGKIALGIVGSIVALGGGWVGCVELTYERNFDATPKPALEASKDPKVIENGAYVANAIAHCGACHGNPEFTQKGLLPPDPKDLRGGYVLEAGPFGTFYPPNLTPHPENGIAKMSDAELARVIRHGVSPNGKYYPLMAIGVGPMSDEDLVALMSYLRSLPPI